MYNQGLRICNTQTTHLPINIMTNDRQLQMLRDIQQAVNALAEGRQSGSYAATTAVPTTGSYAIGDFVKKSNPVEAGAVASKYVIFGWVCTTSGTPGTWKECRFLTGN